MKLPALATVILAVLASPLAAQQYNPPSGTRTSTGGYYPGYGTGSGSSGYLSGTGYSGGYGYGYGCGYGGAWWTGGCRPGFITGYPGFGTIWGGCGGYYGYGSGYGGYYPGYGEGDPYYGHPYYGTAAAAGPRSAPAPAVDRTPQGTALREIEEGRRRFRSGDYRAALDSFRSAVVATPDYPVAQAWFAVSLIAAGDGRNADKAIRAAAAGGLSPGALSLDGLFRDEKERVRMIVALAKTGSDGSLAAAYALFLAGEPARLKQMAEKDPGARRLLP
jgi:hypothetical protein